MVKENISVRGTARCARIQSPMRMCQPVSPSLSRERTPAMLLNRNTSGIRKATSVSDGIRWKIGLVLGWLMLLVDQRAYELDQRNVGREKIQLSTALVENHTRHN